MYVFIKTMSIKIVSFTPKNKSIFYAQILETTSQSNLRYNLF